MERTVAGAFRYELVGESGELLGDIYLGKVKTWNDPAVAIHWPVASDEVVLSDKDLKLGRFADFVSPFTYQGP